MTPTPTLQAYTAEVWRAVGTLWPNLGRDPASTIQPFIPVLPAYLAECHGKGGSPESTAFEVLRFFLDIYVREALSPEERKEQLVDLHALSKRSFEESQKVPVLRFTAALVGAHHTLTDWAAAGKVDPTAVHSLDTGVLRALLGKEIGEMSRLGWMTIEAAGKPPGPACGPGGPGPGGPGFPGGPGPGGGH
jgi:hypothetical protein